LLSFNSLGTLNASNSKKKKAHTKQMGAVGADGRASAAAEK
jgi:hypothetical protein